MHHIVGIGNTGSKIVDFYKKGTNKTKLYKILVDDGFEEKLKKQKILYIKECKSPEEYENNFTGINSFIKLKKNDDISIILDGSESVSCILLKMLENFKKNNILIYYIKQDIDFLYGKELKIDRVVFNVLQQYTLSRLIESMYMFSIPLIETDIMGNKTISENDIHKCISEIIYSIDEVKKIKPIVKNSAKSYLSTNIKSFGIVNIDEEVEKIEEKKFYSIDNIKEIEYHLIINKEKITNTNMGKIKHYLKEKRKEDNEVLILYNVYKSEYEQNYGYVIYKSHEIQK